MRGERQHCTAILLRDRLTQHAAGRIKFVTDFVMLSTVNTYEHAPQPSVSHQSKAHTRNRTEAVMKALKKGNHLTAAAQSAC